MATTYEDLLSVIGKDAAQVPGYCSCDYRSNGPLYWDWEANVATPRLNKLGYTVVRYMDGERDSFGPLTRVVVVRLNGVESKLIYG